MVSSAAEGGVDVGGLAEAKTFCCMWLTKLLQIRDMRCRLLKRCDLPQLNGAAATKQTVVNLLFVVLMRKP